MNTILLNPPFRAMVVGSTGAGKTEWVAQLLQQRNRMFSEKFDKIYFCSKHHSSVPDEIRHIVNFHKGLPSEQMTNNPERKPVLIIIDDLMEGLASDQISQLFLNGRHVNLSAILISQMLFPKQRFSREISLNSNYITLFPNPRDMSQIGYFARQVFPTNPTAFKECFYKNTDKDYSYFFFDFTPNRTSSSSRFYQDIFSETPTTFIYNDDEKNKTNEEVVDEL